MDHLYKALKQTDVLLNLIEINTAAVSHALLSSENTFCRQLLNCSFCVNSDFVALTRYGKDLKDLIPVGLTLKSELYDAYHDIFKEEFFSYRTDNINSFMVVGVGEKKMYCPVSILFKYKETARYYHIILTKDMLQSLSVDEVVKNIALNILLYSEKIPGDYAFTFGGKKALRAVKEWE